jgi:hypothetical protein
MKITKSQLVQIIKEEVESAVEETYSAGSNDPAALPPGTKIGGKTLEEIVAGWLASLQADAQNASTISKDPDADRMLAILDTVEAEDIVDFMREKALHNMSPSGPSPRAPRAVKQFSKSIKRDALSEEEGK